MYFERDAALVRELSRREQGEAERSRAQETPNGPERSTPVACCPAQHAADVTHKERELSSEDHCVTKSTQGEKLVAARSNAFEIGRLAAVTSVDATFFRS